jgi:hypothetical protein
LFDTDLKMGSVLSLCQNHDAKEEVVTDTGKGGRSEEVKVNRIKEEMRKKKEGKKEKMEEQKGEKYSESRRVCFSRYDHRPQRHLQILTTGIQTILYVSQKS